MRLISIFPSNSQNESKFPEMWNYFFKCFSHNSPEPSGFTMFTITGENDQTFPLEKMERMNLGGICSKKCLINWLIEQLT